MNIEENICPHCSHEIKIEAIDIDQEINCANCGRKLVIKGMTQQKHVSKEEESEPEIFLLFTSLTILFSMIGNTWLNLGYTLFATISLAILYAHGKSNDLLTGQLAKKIKPSLERLKIYPYEIFLPLGWLGLITLSLAESQAREPVAFILLAISIWMSLQARKMFRQAITVQETIKFSSPKEFLQFLFSSKQKSRTEVDPNDKNFNEQFKNAAAKQEKITKKENQELQVRQERKVENKEWREEVDQRYDSWLDKESDRLKKHD